MGDETMDERRRDPPPEPAACPTDAWGEALEGPGGGPDDVDAVHDLSGFPDLSYRDFRWKRWTSRPDSAPDHSFESTSTTPR